MKYNLVHPHCGPFNTVNELQSTNIADATCWEHDKDYGDLQKKHGKLYPYTHYTASDELLVQRMDKLGYPWYSAPFKIKKKIFKNDAMPFQNTFRYVDDRPFKATALPTNRRRNRYASRIQRNRASLQARRNLRIADFSAAGGRSFRYRSGYGAYPARTYTGSFRRSTLRRKSFRKRRRMPRKYRRRRRYKRRKRRYNTRRFRHYITSLLAPPRTYIRENSAGLDVLAGRYHYWCPAAHLDVGTLESAWTATGDQSKPLVGDGSNQDNQRALLSRASTVIKFHNNNLHNMYIKVYWVRAKTRITDGTNDVCQKIIDYIINGWNDRILDASEGEYTEVSSVLNDANVSGYAISSTLANLSIFSSYRLKMDFRVKPGKGGWLAPGQTTQFTFKRKYGKSLRYEEIKTGGNHRTLPGYTVVPVFRINMAMGNDTTTNTQSLNMDGVANCHIFNTITWKFVDTKPALTHIDRNTTTAFGVGGGAPSMDVQQVDE